MKYKRSLCSFNSFITKKVQNGLECRVNRLKSAQFLADERYQIAKRQGIEKPVIHTSRNALDALAVNIKNV